MPNHSDDRQDLASSLKALRLDAGLSTTELARRLGWSQSKVSRVERGVTLAKPAEVDEWARMLHAASTQRRRLIELAEQQGVELLEWKRAVAPGRRRLQQEIEELESAASVAWEFSMDVVPGLVQTARYAEAMFRIGRDRAIPDQEVEEATTARLARQAVLDHPGKRFNLLFSETAVRRSVLPRADMQAQLRQLVTVSQRPNVQLGMIPFSAAERTHTYLAFAVLGDPDREQNALMLAETVTRTLTVRAPEEVREYIEHYDRLAEGAVFGDELRALLAEISAQAPWS
ncbi:MAG TPA: helix-turn-helix transcriptional regulator [Pseudonocardia sp.]|uniref:helix-turn-helix domain-containing protein n=1 Tax=Pseudonocardia sp. TaxID=60912 RepID=UPI002F404482